MNDRPVDITTVAAPCGRFDTAIEWLMVALLVFMPLAFGAVAPWSELIVIVLIGAMLCCLSLRLIAGRRAQLVWSWAYVPVGLFVLLAAGQLVCFPVGLIGAISPGTVARKTELLGDLPNAAQLLKSMSITFYPHATKHDLRMLLAAAGVFFVVVNVYRSSDQIKRLLAAIAVIGGAIALLAIVQVISGTEKIYWLFPGKAKVAHSGTFINHSNYSQFINLSIGAGLGLLIVRIYRDFPGRGASLAKVSEHLASSRGRIIWGLGGMVAVGAASVFLSLSRGGAISLLVAAGLTAVMIAWRRILTGRGWIMAIMALMALVCVLYVGFDAVHDRLATLSQRDHYEGRWEMTKDVVRAWTRFPALGTGLGTHEVVYPMFDSSTDPALAAHAENDYAQVLEETGIIGLGLLGAFGAIVWRNYFRCVRKAHLGICSAGFGVGFGLLAIMVHSFSDFGQHLPANACLSAAFCGLLIVIARTNGSNETRARQSATGRGAKALGLSLLLAVVGIWGWSLRGAVDARAAAGQWAGALRIEDTLRREDWLGSNADYAALITHAAAASRREPDNVKYLHWLNVYRWRSVSRVADPKTGRTVVTPRTLEFTERIVDELHRARTVCPTFGPTYCVVGQLEKFVLGREIGARHIRTGFALGPCDATVCYVAGLLDVHEGKYEASLEKFRRAAALNEGVFYDAADVYIEGSERPGLAVDLAGDQVPRLLHVARMLSNENGHRQLADEARSRAVVKLQAKCEQPDASGWALAALADIYRRQKDYLSAVSYYRRALSLDYGQVHWRIALSQALANAGQTDQAIHEARICLRLRPEMSAAKRLIADFSAIHDGAGEYD